MCGTDGNCSCGTNEHGAEHLGLPQRAPHLRDEAESSAAYGVEGMTCSHCVSAVTTELSRLDGVTDVSVELNAGGISTVNVASNAPLSRDQVAEAIDEAGYELVDSPR